MRIKRYIRIVLLSLIFLTCSSCIGREIKQELLSPDGVFKIIVQSVNGGTATEHLNKVFVLRKDIKLRNSFTPILITIEGNIVNIYWNDDENIYIKVKSESLIRYQVKKDYLFYITVEVEEDHAIEGGSG